MLRATVLISLFRPGAIYIYGEGDDDDDDDCDDIQHLRQDVAAAQKRLQPLPSVAGCCQPPMDVPIDYTTISTFITH